MKIKIICIIGLFTLCALTLQAQEDFGMRMHVINVGQAESILLEFQNHAILVDAGVAYIENSDNKIANQYQYHLRNYLKQFFKRRADLKNTFYAVVNSHPHSDHANYLSKIFTKKYKIENFIESGDFDVDKDNDDNLSEKYFADNKITHYKLYDNKTGEQKDLENWATELKKKSGIEIKFLNGYREKCKVLNNLSLAMRVTFGSKTFFMAGDSEDDDIPFEGDPNDKGCGGLIPYLLEKYKSDFSLLKANVYKAGHHGSRNGTTPELLAAMKPEYAVISAGDYRIDKYSERSAWGYGHPSEVTVKSIETEFKKSQVKEFRPIPLNAFTMKGQYKPKTNRIIKDNIYCTCWDGDVIFTVNKAGDDISVDTKKSE